MNNFLIFSIFVILNSFLDNGIWKAYRGKKFEKIISNSFSLSLPLSYFDTFTKESEDYLEVSI